MPNLVLCLFAIHCYCDKDARDPADMTFPVPSKFGEFAALAILALLFHQMTLVPSFWILEVSEGPDGLFLFYISGHIYFTIPPPYRGWYFNHNQDISLSE